MRASVLLLSLAWSSSAVVAQGVFDYPSEISDFDNGLRLVTVPTPHPGVCSVHIVVSVGSRDEVEAGKSGFAHFFEHMMFRGSKNYSAEEQLAAFKRMGAARNAYTTDDYTCYHTTFPRRDLEQVLEIEADRFKHLEYAEDAFRTEAGAVRGEYDASAANPLNKLLEAVRAAAFQEHTYRHTTIGLFADIERMPEQYDYSREFFARHYRPENTTLLVVGDVQPREVRRAVQRYWADWQPTGMAVVPAPVPEPEQTEAVSVHVPWTTPTRPWLMFGFKGPSFSVERDDMVVLDVIAELLFGESSALYERLYGGGVVDVLMPMFPDRTDPYLVSVLARVVDPADLSEVRRALGAACARLTTEPVDEAALRRVTAHLRYAFAARLASPDGIADALVGYIARTRTPLTANRVYEMYGRVTPADVQRVAREYFRDERRVVGVLSHEAAAEAAAGEVVVDVPVISMPSESPLVSVRVAFATGAAADPPDRAGLAHLTARVMARGESGGRSADERNQRLFPMAASIDFQVDKEMTVFHATVHRDNLEAFYPLLRDVLLDPAFSEVDVERERANTVGMLDTGLRRSDDEELGKEVLYTRVYAGHPYGWPNVGRLDALAALTAADLREFYREWFTADRVRVGVAGGFAPTFAERLAADLARGLPRPRQDRTLRVPPVPEPEVSQMTIVQKEARGTGIHIGMPIPVNRSHREWLALWLVRSYLGEHRSENSHLFQRLREVRGLNYGDYAYIEYFPDGGSRFVPPTNRARSEQMFQIWLRPVQPANGPFALKAALFELRKLIREGLSEAEFEATRDYLTASANLLAQTEERRLGYAMDAAFYGIAADFQRFVREGLGWLTVHEVNRTLRRYLRGDRLHIVVVTEDADGFRDAVLGEVPTPPDYGDREVPAAVAAEDAEIAAMPVGVEPAAVVILPVAEVFR